jgi:hypothetical protein
MFGLTADWISTTDAKQRFFLEGRDLAALEVKKVGGGIGCGGARRYYRDSECMRAAVEKYGEDGLTRKREARAKREANKQNVRPTQLKRRRAWRFPVGSKEALALLVRTPGTVGAVLLLHVQPQLHAPRQH